MSTSVLGLLVAAALEVSVQHRSGAEGVKERAVKSAALIESNRLERTPQVEQFAATVAPYYVATVLTPTAAVDVAVVGGRLYAAQARYATFSMVDYVGLIEMVVGPDGMPGLGGHVSIERAGDYGPGPQVTREGSTITIHVGPIRISNQALALAAAADSLFIVDSFAELDRYVPGGMVAESRKIGSRDARAFVDGDRVYIAARDAGLVILRRSGPDGTLEEFGRLDPPVPSVDVAARDGIAFVASGTSTLAVVSALERLEIYVESTVFTGHAVTAVALSGPLVYAAGGGRLSVVDASSGTSPQIVGGTAVAGDAVSLTLVGGLLFCAAGEAGVSVYSCADPRHPRPVFRADTPGFAARVVEFGRLIAVADGDFGVHFFAAPAAPAE
jgi:hypothetical protein